jgi:hypothetical protein
VTKIHCNVRTGYAMFPKEELDIAFAEQIGTAVKTRIQEVLG